LENRRDQDDEVPRGMWEAMETGAGEIRVGEAKGRRSKRRSRKKEGRKGKEEETEKRENSGSKESSRRVGDIG